MRARAQANVRSAEGESALVLFDQTVASGAQADWGGGTEEPVRGARI